MKFTNNKEFASYAGLGIAWAIFVFAIFYQPIQSNLIQPIKNTIRPLHSLEQGDIKEYDKEVYGFLPFWTMHNADDIDFETLTTLAYFDVKIDPNGQIIKDDPGYQSFVSKEATEIFKEAHQHGTRVVLTLTLMDNSDIELFLDNKEAQENIIQEATSMVEKRGIDGINIDIEYDGDAGDHYRSLFTQFAQDMTEHMHAKVPASKVHVSVYASGVRYPKVQNIDEVAAVTDGVFIMGYDFAMASSDVAMPTAPFGGHAEGEYWYDMKTAIDDFLAVAPANKLIMGTPWYGLNFEVYEPTPKAETVYNWWYGRNGQIQTFDNVQEYANADRSDASDYIEGWDNVAKVSYRAYYIPAQGTWRMVYFDDARSLAVKYDYAIDHDLQGVGMWALGFEGKEGKELWDITSAKFGKKQPLAQIQLKQILTFN